MPASIKLQQEYGDALQVIFVESQGADQETSEAFAWRQKWMGTRAMWTTEPPVQVEGNMLPKFALLDNEGKLLLDGNPLDMKKKIEEAIADQVKKSKAAPAGTPDGLAKTWARFAKGEVAAAMAECDKLGADAALAGPAQNLKSEMVSRAQGSVARGKWLAENGYVAEASDLLNGLSKSVKGSPDLEKAVADELAHLQDKSIAAEAEASKALASLQQKMIKDKPFEDANVKALQKLADKHAGTKAGARAAQLAKLAAIEFK